MIRLEIKTHNMILIEKVQKHQKLKTLKPKELKAIEDSSDDNEKHLKYKKVFNELSNERIGEIYNIRKEISFNNWTYHFKGSNNAPINFIYFVDNIWTKINEKDQKQFKSKLNEITTGNPKHKSKDQLDRIKNIKNLYKSRDKVLKLYNDYAEIMSEALYKTKQGTGLKILTTKQMLTNISCTIKRR